MPRQKKLQREYVFLSPNLVEALEKLAIEKGFTAKSALIRHIVTEYINTHAK
ncbi:MULTISPECIES: ribbon-helix-helix protein, CopG family [unclassified Microcoleus]|uniref:ribbon-helix-helix protein, CopG family n=1 Tax=unclassified Microcoleus TaxID=2642155 RepID=UPI002FD57A49